MTEMRRGRTTSTRKAGEPRRNGITIAHIIGARPTHANRRACILLMGGRLVLSAVILLTSSALALFYLQATCEATLRREFDSSRLCGLVNAYRLEFSSVRSELQTIGISID